MKPVYEVVYQSVYQPIYQTANSARFQLLDSIGERWIDTSSDWSVGWTVGRLRFIAEHRDVTECLQDIVMAVVEYGVEMVQAMVQTCS